MIVKPKTRGFICTTAHPKGCAVHVHEQIHFIKNRNGSNPLTINSLSHTPKKVLVIGASTGYGLASRITAAFGYGAKTLGLFYEKPPTEGRTGSAGWYNTAAFEEAANAEGVYAKSLNGDAFSNEMKEEALSIIKNDLGKVDLIIYSLASPRRVHPNSGEVFNSVIKPIGKAFTNKTVDFHSGIVSEVCIESATDNEIANTIAVMGGEDWEMWIDALQKSDLLAEGVKTVAFSYIGPEVTHAVYKDGTIGMAKIDLERTAAKLQNKLAALNGKANISVNKALVTQASSAIPVVPLYISILYKIMKNLHTHEGCIEQMSRLFADRLYANTTATDESGRIRLDDLEMQENVQLEVSKLWSSIETDSLPEMSDIKGYREDFYKLFGFGLADVNYEEDVDIMVTIQSIEGQL